MLSLTVEVPCGYDIKRACEEGICLAQNLNVLIKFNFNDVLVFVSPNSDIDKLLISFREQRKNITDFKIACGL